MLHKYFTVYKHIVTYYVWAVNKYRLTLGLDAPQSTTCLRAPSRAAILSSPSLCDGFHGTLQNVRLFVIFTHSTSAFVCTEPS
jgi:hypothetical protein